MDDVADEVDEGTFVHVLNERELTFRKIRRGQLMMLERYVETLQAKTVAMIETKDATGVLAASKKINDATWATVESQFTSPEDLEWVQMEIIAGRLVEKDLLPLLSNGQKRDVPDDDADPVPVKRPGRKAPAKKAAKKAPARRAAS